MESHGTIGVIKNGIQGKNVEFHGITSKFEFPNFYDTSSSMDFHEITWCMELRVS